jgi:hypothetical protein
VVDDCDDVVVVLVVLHWLADFTSFLATNSTPRCCLGRQSRLDAHHIEPTRNPHRCPRLERLSSPSFCSSIFCKNGFCAPPARSSIFDP